jgi:BolA protein
MGRIAGTLREKLSVAFAPEELEVEDDSARHAGHAGATPGGESHFNIRIRSPANAWSTGSSPRNSPGPSTPCP